MKQPVIITGQTGTGKTAYALQLAREKGGEIVSADARQVYKKLTIVTGKDVGDSFYTKVDTIKLDDNRIADIGYYTYDGIRVWGYDIVDVRTHFSSYDYKVVANHILRNAIEKNTIPIIVGGTHLYLRHLTQDFDVHTSPNWKLRKELEALSISELQARLTKIDKTVYELMNVSDQKNPRRLVRKIEIASQRYEESTKESLPSLDVKEKIGLRFSTTDECRMILEKRIKQRIEQGALNEVVKLLDEGYTLQDPGLQAIGYKELIGHVKGEYPLEEAVTLWLTAEVQYAKRQLSFMQQDSQIQWQHAII